VTALKIVLQVLAGTVALGVIVIVLIPVAAALHRTFFGDRRN
jgi:hypothetical protein